jgi:hypothetical protein
VRRSILSFSNIFFGRKIEESFFERLQEILPMNLKWKSILNQNEILMKYFFLLPTFHEAIVDSYVK